MSIKRSYLALELELAAADTGLGADEAEKWADVVGVTLKRTDGVKTVGKIELLAVVLLLL